MSNKAETRAQGGPSSGASADPQMFACCSRKQLQLFKCPACFWFMCYCSGCQSVFTDLRNCSQTSAVIKGQFHCPRCYYDAKEFWREPGARITRQEIIDDGLEHVLAGGPAPNLSGLSSAELNTAAHSGYDPPPASRGSSGSLSKPDTKAKPAPDPLPVEQPKFFQPLPEDTKPLSLPARWLMLLRNKSEELLTNRNVLVATATIIIMGTLAFIGVIGFEAANTRAVYFNGTGRYIMNVKNGAKEAQVEITLLQYENKIHGHVKVDSLWLLNQPSVVEALEAGEIARDKLLLQSKVVPIDKDTFVRKVIIDGVLIDRGLMTGKLSFHFPELDFQVKNYEFEARKLQQ